MPLEMLRQISASPLPQTFEASADVDKVRVLRAAGLVAALFLEPPSGGNSEKGTQAVRVLAITEAGHAALRDKGGSEVPGLSSKA